jgi:orotidine-5'-phosphate decarboxylase
VEAEVNVSQPSPVLQKLESRMEASNSLLCVGLDPEQERIAQSRYGADARNLVVSFCSRIVELTAEYACAFKLNTAFFEARGAAGWAELESVMELLHRQCPNHFLICDAKRADIGNTNRGYVHAIFDSLRADAITLHPYLGEEALAPFLEREDKASIILCRTSNAGAGELQDLLVNGKPLWEVTAARVTHVWNTRQNCMLVVGATWPEEMRRVREIGPEMTLLVPGIGAQGGDVGKTVGAGLRADGKGLVISSSRAILYSDDPAAAARATRDEINSARERVHGDA